MEAQKTYEMDWQEKGRTEVSGSVFGKILAIELVTRRE